MTESRAPAGRQLLVVRLEPRPPVARDGRVHGPLELPERRPLSRDELDIAAKYLKAADPLYYSCLVNKHTKKHLKKRAVRHHLLKFAYMMKDGSIYLNQTFAAGTDQERKQQEARLKAREVRELEQAMIEAREQRLKLARENGDVAITPLGCYYETQPCSICMVCHPVTLLTMDFSPCPGSVQNKYFYPPSEPTPLPTPSTEQELEEEAESPAEKEAPCPASLVEASTEEQTQEQDNMKINTVTKLDSVCVMAETSEEENAPSIEEHSVSDYDPQPCQPNECCDVDTIPESSGHSDDIDMSWLPYDCPDYIEIVTLETKISAQWKTIEENLKYHGEDIDEPAAIYAEACKGVIDHSDVLFEVPSTDVTHQPEKDCDLNITQCYSHSDTAAVTPPSLEKLEAQEDMKTANDKDIDIAIAPPKPVASAVGDEKRKKRSAYRAAYEQAINRSVASLKPTSTSTGQRHTISTYKMAYEKAVQKSITPPKPVVSGAVVRKRSAYMTAYEEALKKSAASAKPYFCAQLGQKFSAYKAAYEKAITRDRSAAPNAVTESPPPKTATSGVERRQNRSLYRDAYERAVSKSAVVQPQPALSGSEQGQKLSACRDSYKKATTGSVATPKPALPGFEKKRLSVSRKSIYEKAVTESAAPPEKVTVSEAEKRQIRSAYRDAYEKAVTISAVVQPPPAVSGSGQQRQKWSTFRAAYEKAVTESSALPKPVALSRPVQRRGRSVYRDTYEKAVTESVVAPVASGTGQSESSYEATCEEAESVTTPEATELMQWEGRVSLKALNC